MKKLINIAVSLIITIVTFTSCGGDVYDVDNITQQTMLVIWPWTGSDHSLKSMFKQNQDSIEKAIIANDGLGYNKLLVFKSSSADNSTLYEITYNGSTCEEKQIKDYTGNVYATKEGLTEIINDAKNYAPALNYAMVIGGHGLGWIYKDDYSGNSIIKYSSSKSYAKAFAKSAETVIEKRPMENDITRLYGSSSDTETQTDIDVLASAIEASGTKLQYIYFDACDMANIETAYELKNATNFLIASPGEINIIGMPYYSVFTYMSSNAPAYASIVSGFVNFYTNLESFPYGALTAIDCRQLDALGNVMKKVNAEYAAKASSEKDSIDNLLVDSVQYYDGERFFFDIQDYVKHLNISSSLYKEFNTKLSNAIKSAATTATLYSEPSKTYISIKNSCGITISDCSKQAAAIAGREKTGWWQATH